jgi:G3E family GTPase
MFSNEAFSKLDWVVIETTGLADPAPLIQSFYMDSECQKRMRVDSVITVVDCKHLPLHLSSKDQKVGVHGDISEAIRQISYADRIILNKTDLVGNHDMQSLKKSISDINPFAKMFECVRGHVDIAELLNIGAFDAKRFHSLYSETIPKAIFIQRDEKGKISKEKIRVKIGAANVSSRKGSISSFSFVTSQPIDINKFNEWISLILQTSGAKIYRMKGILHMQGYEEIFVCHGVHMIFDGEKTNTKWGAKKDSKLVFIGPDLNKDQLEEGFKSTFIDT